MTAETLRRAASLMRERAEAALPANPRWEAYRIEAEPNRWTMTGIGVPGDDQGHRAEAMFAEDAIHIASWHPTVALAVADLLDRAADDHDETPCPAIDAALAVARAYLGETP